MLTALIFIIIVSLGGFAITYLIDDEENMLWRVAAGAVIGQCIFGTLAFALAMALGFTAVSIVIAMLISLVPLVLLKRPQIHSTFRHDLAKAKGRLQGANATKALGFAYYLFFVILFIAFFDRAYFTSEQGIFTGGSNNLGDLPFHLGIIYSFVEGANFPPMNPSFAGAKLSYPFVPDLITAAFVKLGVGVREAMLVLNVSWALSLLVVLERFAYRLVGDKFASRIAPALLFFSGGLGFLWFISDFNAQAKGFFDFLNALPKDYTIGTDFRWGNSLVTLFLTQRSLLLGMPLTLIVLGYLWKTFATNLSKEEETTPPLLNSSTPLLVGLLAGLLPLVHLHSLFVLFVVTGFLFIFQSAKWRTWIAFGVGVCIIAVPELLWSISGSATNATEFFAIHIGWDSGKTNLIWFWIKNTGLLMPLVAAGIYLYYATHKIGEKLKDDEESRASLLLQFYVPFLAIFLLANIAKLAPWEWDNIKVLIYWFIGSIPFVAYAISWVWQKSSAMKVAAALGLGVLIFAGSLDVWRTVSRQINYKVFEGDAAIFALRAKGAMPPSAVIVNAPTYNTAAVLTGRSSLIRYPGHLGSHGINYGERERDVKQMYLGGPLSLVLFEKYGVEYLLISPEERNTLTPNLSYFAQFPVVAEAGQYKLYKVR